MNRLPRIGVCGLAACLAVRSLAADDPNVDPAAAMVAALEAEIAALRAVAWTPAAAVSAALGWRDNVLLSSFAPIGRPFGQAGVEAILFRPRRHDCEVALLLNGEVLRYFSPPPEAGGEQRWDLQSELRWEPVDAFQLAVKAVGYWQDSVIDLSETAATRIVAPTRLRGGSVATRPFVDLPAGFNLEPMAQITRHDYRDYNGDYDEAKGGARLEWRHAASLVISAAWFEVGRRYHQRTDYTSSGRPLPDTQLRFRQREGELRARMAWKARGDWTVTGTISRLKSADRASGYFDFSQKRAGLDFAWASRNWRTSVAAEARRTNYRLQTVGSGITPPARIADDFETHLRAERSLKPSWILFAEHRWERCRSNEEEFSYRMNTLMTGVQRRF